MTPIEDRQFLYSLSDYYFYKKYMYAFKEIDVYGDNDPSITVLIETIEGFTYNLFTYSFNGNSEEKISKEICEEAKSIETLLHRYKCFIDKKKKAYKDIATVILENTEESFNKAEELLNNRINDDIDYIKHKNTKYGRTLEICYKGTKKTAYIGDLITILEGGNYYLCKKVKNGR